jgi:hypothetical protein
VLLAHLLKEARGHASAQNDVEKIGREAPVARLRRPGHAEADMDLFEAAARTDLHVLM